LWEPDWEAGLKLRTVVMTEEEGADLEVEWKQKAAAEAWIHP
jgi:hypothetical protein